MTHPEIQAVIRAIKILKARALVKDSYTPNYGAFYLIPQIISQQQYDGYAGKTNFKQLADFNAQWDKDTAFVEEVLKNCQDRAKA